MDHRPILDLRRARALALGLLLAGVAGAAAALPAAAGVSVAILPSTVNVAPGAEFDVTIDVTPAGSPFNGFVAIVGYDTTALTLVPAPVVSTQQGCLMTGACSAACGNTFHRFTPAADSISITDHLLCDQIALTGPGTVYKLRFRAGNENQVTWIRLRRATFYNAGLFVTPVTTADARVGIGVPLAVEGETARVPGLSVRAEPNPSRGAVALAIATDREGDIAAEILDVTGRLVRRLEAGKSRAGVSRFAWDGADRAGARVPPGIYLVSVSAGGRVARTRIVVLD